MSKGRKEPEPTCQDAKPRVQPGVHPPFYITNVVDEPQVKPGVNPSFYATYVVGEPQVKPGVWRPEMWALVAGDKTRSGAFQYTPPKSLSTSMQNPRSGTASICNVCQQNHPLA
jgi:hypothetical protein